MGEIGASFKVGLTKGLLGNADELKKVAQAIGEDLAASPLESLAESMKYFVDNADKIAAAAAAYLAFSSLAGKTHLGVAVSGAAVAGVATYGAMQGSDGGETSELQARRRRGDEPFPWFSSGAAKPPAPPAYLDKILRAIPQATVSPAGPNIDPRVTAVTSGVAKNISNLPVTDTLAPAPQIAGELTKQRAELAELAGSINPITPDALASIARARAHIADIDHRLGQIQGVEFKAQAHDLAASISLAEKQLELVGQEGTARAETLAQIASINAERSAGVGFTEEQIAALAAEYARMEAIAEKTEEITEMESLRASFADGTPREQELEHLEMINELLAGGTLSMQEQNAALAEQQERLLALGELGFFETMGYQLSQLIIQTKELGQAIGTVIVAGIDNMIGGLSTAIANARSLNDAFAGAVKTMLAGIIEIGIKWALGHALRLVGIKVETGAKMASIATIEAGSIAATIKSSVVSTIEAGKQFIAWLPAAVTASIGTIGGALAFGAAAIALITSLKDGGMVYGPGSGRSDSVPAMLSAGEYVMPAAMTSRYKAELDMMRAGGFDALEAIPGLRAGGLLAAPRGGGDAESDLWDDDEQSARIENIIELNGDEILRQINETSIARHGFGFTQRRPSAA